MSCVTKREIFFWKTTYRNRTHLPVPARCFLSRLKLNPRIQKDFQKMTLTHTPSVRTDARTVKFSPTAADANGHDHGVIGKLKSIWAKKGCTGFFRCHLHWETTLHINNNSTSVSIIGVKVEDEVFQSNVSPLEWHRKPKSMLASNDMTLAIQWHHGSWSFPTSAMGEKNLQLFWFRTKMKVVLDSTDQFLSGQHIQPTPLVNESNFSRLLFKQKSLSF